jgi:hypothetical protein
MEGWHMGRKFSSKLKTDLVIGLLVRYEYNFFDVIFLVGLIVDVLF